MHAPLDEYSGGRWWRTSPCGRWTRIPSTTRTACAAGVRRLDTLRRRISRFFFEDRVEPVTPAELEAAHEEHAALPAHEEEELPAVTSSTSMPVGD